MTLKDLLDVLWTVVEVDITARDPEGVFLHEWIYGPDIKVSAHMAYEINKGKLTVVNAKVNEHGNPKGSSIEMGWGVNKKLFPKDIIEALIKHMTVGNRQRGDVLRVDIEMQPLTVMTLVEDSKQKVIPG